MDICKAPSVKARTGIPGLDDILAGGLATGHLFLLEGSPGTGKTTIALRFLLEGAGTHERGLYITLSETKEELEAQFQAWGEPTYRVAQILEWLYVHRATNWDAMSNLPKLHRR